MTVPDADGGKRWLVGSPWSLAVFRACIKTPNGTLGWFALALS
jgi:hypothetical protein